MDGYEDLPILLSVIQSNKVNIYCIYIKNYPGIEWRRVAFIGVFPGVTSPQMRACGGREKVQEHVPNLFKPLHPPLPPPRGVLHTRLCPRPGPALPAAAPPRVQGSQGAVGGWGWGQGEPLSKQRPGAQTTRQGTGRGNLGCDRRGRGYSFSLSSVGLHHFLIRHKIVFIHQYCSLHKHHHYGS